MTKSIFKVLIILLATSLMATPYISNSAETTDRIKLANAHKFIRVFVNTTPIESVICDRDSFGFWGHCNKLHGKNGYLGTITEFNSAECVSNYKLSTEVGIKDYVIEWSNVSEVAIKDSTILLTGKFHNFADFATFKLSSNESANRVFKAMQVIHAECSSTKDLGF